jgi:hypothetical protein
MKLSDKYPSDTRVQSPELVGDLSRGCTGMILFITNVETKVNLKIGK